MYRHPKDSETFNFEFYQKKYTQNDGITTDIIEDNELKKLINSNFSNSEKNVSRFVKIFNGLGFKGGNLIDYGSSWGYMTYQFINYGFNTQSFEISEPRAKFGNLKLGLNIKTDVTLLTGNQDLVFSSHVIEHVPSVSNMIESSFKLLKKGGFFISECPNGSKKFRDKFPHLFSQFWGEVHPNLLSAEYYTHIFKDRPFLITTTPYDDETYNIVSSWDQTSQIILNLEGPEILVIARNSNF